MRASKRVLLIAFHFPPIQGSSGVQRTLRFARYLPKHGWQPLVLTIDARAYEVVGSSAGNEVPEALEVHRAFGLDAARSLAIFGHYPRFFSLPDRWASWRLWAVQKALELIRLREIDAIVSTFPIATAHEIGFRVARRSGLPWIAEFRDPMWQGDYPPDPTVNRHWRDLEERVFAHAHAVVVTTPSAAALYADRFPQFGASRIALIENGYDEETFRRAAAGTSGTFDPAPAGSDDRPVTLLHSGIVYPSERDPSRLFDAIAELKRCHMISSLTLRVVFRASGNETEYRARLTELGIADIVHLEPAIAYLAALREMLRADGLLILQAANCNAQIPAKLYEYIRSERPILALTDPAGDTARTLERAKVGQIAPLDSVPQIKSALLTFLSEIKAGSWRRADASTIASLSREAQTGLLAKRLDEALSVSRLAHG